MPWHENAICIAGPLCRESTSEHWLFVQGIRQSLMDSTHKWPVVPSIDIFNGNMNKLLNKHLSCQWSETPWQACDVTVVECYGDKIRPCRNPSGMETTLVSAICLANQANQYKCLHQKPILIYQVFVPFSRDWHNEARKKGWHCHVYIIVLGGFMWYIYPYSAGLLYNQRNFKLYFHCAMQMACHR